MLIVRFLLLDPECGGISEGQSDFICKFQAEKEEVGGEESHKAY